MMKRLFLIFGIVLFCPWTLIQAQQDNTWTLEECISYALSKNIQVRKSELNNQRYQYNADLSKAQRFPSLNASLNQNFNWSRSTLEGESGFSGVNGSAVAVNSSVTLFNASKLTNQIKQSGLELESGKLSLETTKESISLSILDAYLQVLYAEEQVKNTEKQIESTTSQVNLAAERLAMQVISQSDYSKVKSQLASEKLTLANSKSSLALAKVSLEQLMELPVTDDFNISHPDLDAMVNQDRLPDVTSVYETALSIKPQIKGASVDKEIAALDEKIAKAGYYPTLSASAGVSSSFSSQATGPYFDQIDDGITPAVGFSLSVPIYQKKQVKTNVELAKIGYQDAELTEINTKNELRKSIEQACLDVRSAQAEYEANVENYQAMKESSALTDEQFKQGMINSVDYLVSKTNLIVAESELLQSRFNLIYSYKVLDFYTGIPLSL